MMRTLTAVTAASILLAGCSSAPPSTAEPTSTTTCAPAPVADMTTPDGWIGFAAEHPESVSFAVDDGLGHTAEHDADTPHPLASAVKVVHLGAYARAVADGTLDPDERIPVADWQRWYAPGTDGGAHIAALNRLGIANDGTSPTDPAATVRLDDMVTAMVRESDNGVPDYLRYRLGDDALRDAAAAGGWSDFTPPTLVGVTLGALDATVDTDDLWSLAQRFAFDADFRATYGTTARPRDETELLTYFDRFGPTGTAAELARFHTAVADGSYGSGVDTVRRHLEWQDPPADAGFVAMGFKGGNLPGVLTHGFEFRRADGAPAVVVWLNHGLTAAEYESATTNLTQHQTLLLEAAADPATVGRLACIS